MQICWPLCCTTAAYNCGPPISKDPICVSKCILYQRNNFLLLLKLAFSSCLVNSLHKPKNYYSNKLRSLNRGPAGEAALSPGLLSKDESSTTKLETHLLNFRKVCSLLLVFKKGFNTTISSFTSS